MTKSSRGDRRQRPRVGVTIGDPAGIGPEVTLKAVIDESVRAVCDPVIVGDAGYLSHWTNKFGIDPSVQIVERNQPFPEKVRSLILYNLANIKPSIEMGKESAECGRAAAEYIETAVALLRNGDIDAMTTAPVNKHSLFLGGSSFPGHTEFLAHLAGSDNVAMAFFAPELRVALLTTHLALSEVSSRVRKAELTKLIRLVHRELRSYGIDQPRIAMAGLNPHAGEGGLFGSEEATEIIPAIDECRRAGITVTGPYPADTIFLRASRGEFDIVVSCYHDQGLVAVKCLAFGEAVNVTLGLPFIRTSVDHGTAFDIAGLGKADPGSMIAAIKLAAELWGVRRDQQQ
jgi:4-phospho-D-threonate 3-dehydrogenase / 4-phospho-D-erythronate 3-dehydrogenase